MWPASCHKPQYGRSELDRVRRRSGRGTGDLQSCCSVIASIDRFRPRSFAIRLPSHAWHKITWREGTAERLSSRFARVRVRPAHRDYWLAESRPEEWLLIEWPAGEEAPTKYWLSTLPANIGFRQLVDIAKLRWRIERDYHELKQEVGLGHFEGRSWRGFHHHATLCIAAYGFLVSERFPPQKQPPPSSSRKLQFPRLIGRGDPPLRPERHVPNSIASIRRRLNAALVSTLSRCPCCTGRSQVEVGIKIYDAVRLGAAWCR